MFSREFTYTGYDGKEKKDTYYFNLNEAELYELDLSSIYGFTGQMERLLKAERTQEIVDMFKGIILGAVGEVSPDGRRFVKNEQIREDFYRSKAYAQLFVELVSSGEKFSEFLKSAIPEEIRKKMEADDASSKEADRLVIPEEKPQLSVVPGSDEK